MPQVCIATGIDADSAADDFAVVTGDENLTMAFLYHLLEKTVVRDVALQFETVVVMEQLGKSLEFTGGLYDFRRCSTTLCVLYASQLSWEDALFGGS